MCCELQPRATNLEIDSAAAGSAPGFCCSVKEVFSCNVCGSSTKEGQSPHYNLADLACWAVFVHV